MNFRLFAYLLIPLVLTSCGTTQHNCSLLYSQTKEFWHCRAKEGSKEHQFRIGMEYFVKDDFRLAHDWLKKSSQDEYQVETRGLSSKSRLGVGYSHAVREITEDGNEAAAFMMARIYAEGLGVGQDQNRAKTYEDLAETKIVEIEETGSGYVIRVKKLSTLNLIQKKERNFFELYSFEVMPNR